MMKNRIKQYSTVFPNKVNISLDSRSCELETFTSQWVSGPHLRPVDLRLSNQKYKTCLPQT